MISCARCKTEDGGIHVYYFQEQGCFAFMCDDCMDEIMQKVFVSGGVPWTCPDTVAELMGNKT
jgi:hypothetical protein